MSHRGERLRIIGGALVLFGSASIGAGFAAISLGIEPHPLYVIATSAATFAGAVITLVTGVLAVKRDLDAHARQTRGQH